MYLFSEIVLSGKDKLSGYLSIPINENEAFIQLSYPQGQISHRLHSQNISFYSQKSNVIFRWTLEENVFDGHSLPNSYCAYEIGRFEVAWMRKPMTRFQKKLPLNVDFGANGVTETSQDSPLQKVEMYHSESTHWILPFPKSSIIMFTPSSPSSFHGITPMLISL